MYRLKDGVSLDRLREYGFKLGKEYKNYQEFICNEYEYEDYWLVAMDREEVHIVEDTDVPLWSIHIMHNEVLWIDCVPDGTYHIDCLDMKVMFHTLFRMIRDGILEEDDEIT